MTNNRIAPGCLVLVDFPYSDLSGSEVRPAVALFESRSDWALCQITSQKFTDPTAITLLLTDLANGVLNKTSYARPNKLFTANLQIIHGVIGELKPAKYNEILDAIISNLQSGRPQ